MSQSNPLATVRTLTTIHLHLGNSLRKKMLIAIDAAEVERNELYVTIDRIMKSLEQHAAKSDEANARIAKLEAERDQILQNLANEGLL